MFKPLYDYGVTFMSVLHKAGKRSIMTKYTAKTGKSIKLELLC